jgi:hypothetical protein
MVERFLLVDSPAGFLSRFMIFTGKKFVERLRSWFSLSFAASDLPFSEGTHSRGRAGNRQTSDSHGF